MSRYVLTREDRVKGGRTRMAKNEAARKRREAELWLLDRLLAELAMPEMYPAER